MTPTFAGLIPPMISPLLPNGDVDTIGLSAHVDRLISGGVDGLFVLGTSGEGPLLDLARAQQVIAQTVAAAAGRVPVLAGILEPSTPRAVEVARIAADCGADAVVATTPYYIEADDDGIRDHFLQLADRSPLPLILYNIPSKTHHVLTPDIVAEMVDHPNIVGMKDSHGDWTAFERLLALRRPGFTLLQGAEQLCARSILAGADGLVPGLGNVVPRLFMNILRSAQTGDADAAFAYQAQADALGKLHSYGHWLACLKYATSRIGLTHPDTFASASPLSDAACAAIDALVAARQGDTV
jgi:4-hydroxy-tetrahydrodipicolinate synthase